MALQNGLPVALSDTLGRWLGRVEIAFVGLDPRLREAEEALARGDGMRARAAAHAILGKVPGSPLGLALLADACELAGLDAEAHLTLEELAKRAASRPEVWLRLGRARTKTEAAPEEIHDAYLRALAVAPAGSDARREALLALADWDLARGDGPRAEVWLDRITVDKDSDAAPLRAQARLLAYDPKGALRALDARPDDVLDGRSAYLRGRALAALHDKRAFPFILRAYLLELPGASELLSSTIAWIETDAETLERARTVVEGRGELELARFRAAFARAAGDRKAAREALATAVRSGDLTAAKPLFDAALAEGDDAALALATNAIPKGTDRDVDEARAIVDAAPASEGNVGERLDGLRAIRSEALRKWAGARRVELARRWIPTSGSAAWPELLARLDASARAFHDLESIASLADLARERRRPVRIAIVGEFNAGKSTFINALIGADVAPTGVLPTTATLHHLRWAPDPIARIMLDATGDGEAPPVRLVPTSELRATLKTLDAGLVRRVEILMPLPSLTRVEILDTPGFNAPDPRHSAAAREAFEEADAAIWLLDAGQAMKATERGFLEEAKARGLPVQILVNKADRLGPADREKVLAAVRDALTESGLASYRPPVALSARLALAGKLGDAAASEASGFGAVEKLLDEEIVARSDDLKERALRRRAKRIVATLRAGARRAADEEASERTKKTEARAASRRAAARLEESAEDGAKSLAEKAAPALAAWSQDLSLLVTGRDADAASHDPTLVRYRVDRAVARLTEPLTTGLVELARTAGASGDLRPGFTTVVKAVVRSAAWSAPTLDGVAIARAAIGGAVDDLLQRGLGTAEPPVLAGLELELEAIESCLEP
jgi:GTP-binding protein EngB required for normal cell division